MGALKEREWAELQALLADGRLDRAFVSLASWGEALSGPKGRQQARFAGWALAAAKTGTTLGPDDLASADLLRWRDVPVLHLLRAMERRLDGDWQTQGSGCVKVQAANGSHHWLLRKHPGKPTRNDRLQGLARELEAFNVIAEDLQGYVLDIRPAKSRLDQLLLAAAAQAAQLFVGHFDHDLGVDWHEATGTIFARGLADEAAHEVAVRALIDAAAGSTFLVLPECTVPEAMRERMARHIGRMDGRAPLLSVPGSFHDHCPESDPPYQNRCQLIDHRGDPIFRHVKTAAVAVPSKAGGGRMVDEGICTHNTLHLLSTSVGLVGVGICLGFSHPHGRPHAAWERIGPSWMLVPSMGVQSTLDLHRPVAEQLHKTHRTVTLVANQPATGVGFPGFIVPWPRPGEDITNRLVAVPGDLG